MNIIMKQSFFLITLIILTLIFHNEVIDGTSSGLLLWYQSLIPALLPFIIITNALSETHAYDILVEHFQKISPNIYRHTAFILGNLCGYPIGAKILNDFVNENHISSVEANELLSVSSQASPMFLLGFVYSLLPADYIPIPVFLTIIYLPVLCLYMIINLRSRKINDNLTQENNEAIRYYTKAYSANNSISVTFMQAVKTMVIIGIYVIIFSIIICILMPRCNNNTSKCFIGFLEITNGLKLISYINIPKKIRTALLMSLTSFGGLCTAFQIKSVLEYSEASIKKYLQDKMILSAGTFLITILYITYCR